MAKQSVKPPARAESAPSTPAKTNSLAIIGLILAIFLPLVGLVCSIIALTQIKKSNEGGKGLAIAGIVVSVSIMILSFVLVTLFIFGVGKAVDEAAEDYKETVQSEQQKAIDLAQFYSSVQNGQTKEEVVMQAGKDPSSCFESQTEGLGIYETCTWYGSFGNSADYVSVSFHDGQVSTKSKGGF